MSCRSNIDELKSTLCTIMGNLSTFIRCSFRRPLLDYITSGPVIAMELITSNAVTEWRATLGPTDSEAARQDAPETIRAKFGKDKQANAAHGSDSDASATRVSQSNLYVSMILVLFRLG